MRNGKTFIFTPKRTATFERAVAVSWQEHTLGSDPLDGPFSANFLFQPDGFWVTIEPHVAKYKLRGDLDNYVKSALDGLQGVAFTDDRHLVRCTAIKE